MFPKLVDDLIVSEQMFVIIMISIFVVFVTHVLFMKVSFKVSLYFVMNILVFIRLTFLLCLIMSDVSVDWKFSSASFSIHGLLPR